MTIGPRERLISSAIALAQERGIDGTGVSDLLAHSNTARNSIYQHFPAGKSELFAASTEAAGALMGNYFLFLAESRTPIEALESVIGWWKQTLERSAFTAGCPVAAAALTGSETPTVRAAAGRVFVHYQQILATGLTRARLDPAVAASLAGFAVSAIEGAIMQCRSMESLRPLEDAQANLTTLLRTHLDTTQSA